MHVFFSIGERISVGYIIKNIMVVSQNMHVFNYPSETEPSALNDFTNTLQQKVYESFLSPTFYKYWILPDSFLFC